MIAPCFSYTGNILLLYHKNMKHELIELPYTKNSLAPIMSEETLSFHYDKHHLAYVNKLNELQAGTEFENMNLEEIIKSSQGGIFNNAAQIWNHNLFWTSFCSPSQSETSLNSLLQEESRLQKLIESSFGSFENMKEKFKAESLGRFGSGWVWLVQKWNSLEIYSAPNAENPLTEGWTALLGCDVWEHSYYIDYRNDRGAFIDNFWKIVDWKVVEGRLGG